MSGSNALQITDPTASDNLLASAPSWADASGSVADTASAGMDKLGQWLAAQRAKNPQMGLFAGSTTSGENAYIGPGRARVTPPSMLDVQPHYEGEDLPHQPVLSNSEQQWLDVYNSLQRIGAPQNVIDYHLAQNPNAALGARIEAGKQQAQPDADVIMRAIQARQRQEHYPAIGQ